MASPRYVVMAAVLMSALADVPTNNSQTNTTESNLSALEKRSREAEEACRQSVKDPGPVGFCRELCWFKALGALDDAGLYVESGAVDLATVVFPQLTQKQIKQAAKGCRDIDKYEQTEVGCRRSFQVGSCLQREYISLTAKNPDPEFPRISKYMSWGQPKQRAIP